VVWGVDKSPQSKFLVKKLLVVAAKFVQFEVFARIHVSDLHTFAEAISRSDHTAESCKKQMQKKEKKGAWVTTL